MRRFQLARIAAPIVVGLGMLGASAALTLGAGCGHGRWHDRAACDAAKAPAPAVTAPTAPAPTTTPSAPAAPAEPAPAAPSESPQE